METRVPGEDQSGSCLSSWLGTQYYRRYCSLPLPSWRRVYQYSFSAAKVGTLCTCHFLLSIPVHMIGCGKRSLVVPKCTNQDGNSLSIAHLSVSQSARAPPLVIPPSHKTPSSCTLPRSTAHLQGTRPRGSIFSYQIGADIKLINYRESIYLSSR